MTEHFAGASLTLTGDADLRPERFRCVCRGLQTWSEWEKGKEDKRDLMDGPPSSYNRAAAVICFLLNPVVPVSKRKEPDFHGRKPAALSPLRRRLFVEEKGLIRRQKAAGSFSEKRQMLCQRQKAPFCLSSRPLCLTHLHVLISFSLTLSEHHHNSHCPSRCLLECRNAGINVPFPLGSGDQLTPSLPPPPCPPGKKKTLTPGRLVPSENVRHLPSLRLLWSRAAQPTLPQQ